jgi:hypothetical protein
MKHLMLLLLLSFCGYTGVAQATTEFNLYINRVAIQEGGRYRVYQYPNATPTTNYILITTSDSVTLELDNVNIAGVSAPINIRDGARVRLLFRNTNKIEGSSTGYAGINLADNASITIESASASDTLRVKGAANGAGIGTGANGRAKSITIEGPGVVVATGGTNGAGIGTGNATGNNENTIEFITIKGGTVTANGGTPYGAGIGTGNAFAGSSAPGQYDQVVNQVDKINISGGTVNAIGGDNYSAAIGTGNAHSTGGAVYNKIKTITISGGVVKGASQKYAAAIGTGYAMMMTSNANVNISNEVETINIEGGKVTGQGSEYGAGIGTGSTNEEGHPKRNLCKLINISGGIVDALSSAPTYVDIGGRSRYSSVERILISGGNVHATHIRCDSLLYPRNNDNELVVLTEKQNVPNVREVMVDGKPYGIGGNLDVYPPDPNLYMWLPYSATETHVVSWLAVAGDNKLHVYKQTAEYINVGPKFVFTGTAISPTVNTHTTAESNFNMEYLSRDMKISVTTQNADIDPVLVSANDNEVVFKIDDVVFERYALVANDWPGPFSGILQNYEVFSRPGLDMSKFGAGVHKFVVEYGGSASYAPSRFTTDLTITKKTPTASPLQLSAIYGKNLWEIVLPSDYSWVNPDSVMTTIGIQSYASIYCPDTNNYNPITVYHTVNVTKATSYCDVPTELTGDYGSTLQTINLPAPWQWQSPSLRLITMGEQIYQAFADTAKYIYKTCPVKIMVIPASGIFLPAQANKKLELYPNPVLSGQSLKIVLPTDSVVETIDVYNFQGALQRQYFLRDVSSDGNAAEIDVDILHGMYIIKAGNSTATILVL